MATPITGALAGSSAVAAETVLEELVMNCRPEMALRLRGGSGAVAVR